jgi:hypothetical protein
MWGNLIRGVTDQLPQINHDLFSNFHSRHLKALITDLEDLFRQNVRVISNNMNWPDGFFKYLRYRELSPDERCAMLKSKTRKKYEKQHSINPTYKQVLAFMFEFNGELMEMTVDIPYIDNYAIMREGTPYYPIFAITDRGGMCYMKDSILLQVARTKLIFRRDVTRRVLTREGHLISEYLITAKINQSNKARKEPPPILLHHLSIYGLENTLRMYNVHKTLSVIHTLEHDPDYWYVDLGKECYLKIERNSLDIRAKRVVVSLMEIYNFYPNFTVETIHDNRYYTIVTGKWCNTSLEYEVYLMSSAEEYLKMNKTIIDPAHRARHASVGLVYETLDDLMLLMFDRIDSLMADHTRNRIDMLRKRLASTDTIAAKMFEMVNRRVFALMNARNERKPADIRKLMYHLGYRKAISGIKIFRRAPTLYSDNALAVLGQRFTTLTSMDMDNTKGGRTKIPIHLLTMHYSYIPVVSVMTYPASRPIISGSINPYVEVDQFGNIQTPDYVEDLKPIYGDVI